MDFLIGVIGGIGIVLIVDLVLDAVQWKPKVLIVPNSVSQRI